MKILATADSHFGYDYGRTTQAKKQTNQRMFNSFRKTMQYAIKENVDLVLHGGDMFNRSQPKERVISEAYNIIGYLAEEEIPFIGIPGNHDKSRLPESLLNFFNSDMHLLNKFSNIEIDDLIVLGFPFINREPKIILSKTKKIAENNTSKDFLVLCHQLFEGAIFGPHHHVFRNRPDTLVTHNLPSNVRLIISGHIHRSQNLQQNRVFYTGSLERTSFMEIVEPKGYLIIDIDEDYFNVQFQEIETFPMKVIEMDISDEKQISRLVDHHYPSRNIRTQLRFYGRKLTEEEIKFLWAYLPAKEFPFLSFSPRKPEHILRRLYSSDKSYFQIEAS